jgi:CubicO group peptidase (beta-lactamase class C family)/D-alanyl-D-alanine dipeptidase
MIPRPRRLPWVSLLLLLLARLVSAQESVGPADRYREVAERLSAFIEAARAEQKIPAIAIVLVDDQEIVWARGFGTADPATGRPATAQSLCRVGSVSKLFADIAAMQLVEDGKLDLDTPVADLLPEFAPKNPFDRPITVRQLMAHRAGLVREPPAGHYFDLEGPSVAETVGSLARTTLVHEPTKRTKYSNAGIAAVGLIVERLRGKPFAEAVKESVLDRAGMARSTFLMEQPDPDLARGIMWTYDGREFPAPPFRLGLLPASDLYASVHDLGRFLTMLFTGGQGAGGRVLKDETLRSMWEPQFVEVGAKDGFGLGFAVDRFEGCRRVGHSGAVYGFATDLEALPDEKLGAAVVCTRDCANATARRIAETALRLLRAARKGESLPEIERTTPVPAELARKAAGRYADAERGVDLIERDGRLFLLPTRGGSLMELRCQGDRLVTDGPLDHGTPVEIHEGKVRVGAREYERVEDRPPDPAPARWRALIGEYGWDHDTLYILEKDGKLQALIEWFFLYPLDEVATDLFRFPDYGMYDNQEVRFERDGSGRISGVRAAEVFFPRRPIDGEDGQTFRIRPVRPVDALRAEALRAKPPVESRDFRAPELVDLTTLDPSIKLDIRYATGDNFLRTPVYTSARAFLQKPAAEALARAHRSLKEHGFGLLIHDAYRPWYVTKMFRDATPEAQHQFVADPAQGSRHNRGCAVDLTLYDLQTGKAVEMVGGYDEFSHRSAPDYPGGTSLQRWRRDLLRRAMEDQGFTVNEVEWWHFDYKDWREYPILNTPFEEL